MVAGTMQRFGAQSRNRTYLPCEPATSAFASFRPDACAPQENSSHAAKTRLSEEW